jgi:acetoin utilization protein AcuC
VSAPKFTVIVDPDLAIYKFSDSHPLDPIRVLNTYELAKPVLQSPDVLVSRATEQVTATELAAVHTSEFVEAVQAAGAGEYRPGFGIGSMDVPSFSQMHEAGLLVCSATLTATKAVAGGGSIHAVNVGGGLHHAMAAKAAGFCVYNDIAVSIQWLLDHGYERIVYIDIDAHHGDGVQSIFYDDPRVLTISIHESGKSLFPGTGEVHESGGPNAAATSVNIPLPAGTTDADWLRAIDAIVPELLAAFDPQLIFSQHGCDSHFLDPLTHLEISIDAQKIAHEMIHNFAHTYAGGNWIAVGGGGYELKTVVPQTWTNLLAIATHQPELAIYSDGVEVAWKTFSSGRNPASEVDRVIMQVRKEIFPHYGLIVDPNASF